MKHFNILYILPLIFVFSCKTDVKDKQNKKQVTPHVALAKPQPLPELFEKIPELKFYHDRVMESLKNDPPILLLDDKEIRDENQRKAQNIAINNKEFIRDVYQPDTNAPIRNEIMNVRKALPSDIHQS